MKAKFWEIGLEMVCIIPTSICTKVEVVRMTKTFMDDFKRNH